MEWSSMGRGRATSGARMGQAELPQGFRKSRYPRRAMPWFSIPHPTLARRHSGHSTPQALASRASERPRTPIRGLARLSIDECGPGGACYCLVWLPRPTLRWPMHDATRRAASQSLPRPPRHVKLLVICLRQTWSLSSCVPRQTQRPLGGFGVLSSRHCQERRIRHDSIAISLSHHHCTPPHRRLDTTAWLDPRDASYTP